MNEAGADRPKEVAIVIAEKIGYDPKLWEGKITSYLASIPEFQTTSKQANKQKASGLLLFLLASLGVLLMACLAIKEHTSAEFLRQENERLKKSTIEF